MCGVYYVLCVVLVFVVYVLCLGVTFVYGVCGCVGVCVCEWYLCGVGFVLVCDVFCVYDCCCVVSVFVVMFLCV